MQLEHVSSIHLKRKQSMMPTGQKDVNNKLQLMQAE